MIIRTVLLAFLLPVYASAQEYSVVDICFSNDSSLAESSRWEKVDQVIDSNPNEFKGIQLTFSENTLTTKSSPKRIQQSILVVIDKLLNLGIKSDQITFGEAPVIQPPDYACKESSVSLKFIHSEQVLVSGTGNSQTSQRLKPFKNILSTSENFIITTNQETTVETKSGTLITIPANAFLDSEGNLVDGTAELIYEEYRTPLDIFRSGIPMAYSGQIGSGNLESAGMFEIYAQQGDAQLRLANSQTLSIDFQPESNDPDFDFFFLNPATNSWKLQESSMSSTLIETEDFGDYAVLEFMKLTNTLRLDSADRTTNEELFEDLSKTRETWVASLKRKKRVKEENLEQKLERYVQKYAPISLSFKKQSRKNRDGSLTFTVHCGSSFSEWSVFHFYEFEYNGELSPNELKQRLSSTRFIDLRLRIDSNSNRPILVLKGVNDFTRLPVRKFDSSKLERFDYSHLEQEKRREMIERREKGFNRVFDNRFRTYSRHLQRQERAKQTAAERHDRKAHAKYQRSMIKAWKKTKPLMTDYQAGLNLEKWKEYCESRKEQALELLSEQRRSEMTVRKISIGTLGIFNIDRLKELRRPKKVNPQYVAGNEQIDWDRTYLFDKEINSVFTFFRSNGRITLDPNTLNTLIVMDSQGQLFILEDSALKDINGTLKLPEELAVRPLEDSDGSIQFLQTKLGL